MMTAGAMQQPLTTFMFLRHARNMPIKRILWVRGATQHQTRHYSQFMALQLKARYEGIPTPVYELAPVHHRA